MNRNYAFNHFKERVRRLANDVIYSGGDEPKGIDWVKFLNQATCFVSKKGYTQHAPLNKLITLTLFHLGDDYHSDVESAVLLAVKDEMEDLAGNPEHTGFNLTYKEQV